MRASCVNNITQYEWLWSGVATDCGKHDTAIRRNRSGFFVIWIVCCSEDVARIAAWSGIFSSWTPFRLLQGSRNLLANDCRLRKGRSVKLRSHFNLVLSFGILGTVCLHGLALPLPEGKRFYVSWRRGVHQVLNVKVKDGVGQTCR